MKTEARCWFHTYEPIPDDVYRICAECGHAWLESELIERYNEMMEGLDEEWIKVSDAEGILSCMLCGHDF